MGGVRGRGRHLVGRNRRRVVRIKGVEPEEHPHCSPTHPPRQRGRTRCCAVARRQVLQRCRPAARGASVRPAGCSDSHRCRCSGAARSSGQPRLRPRGTIPAVALAGWPFTAQAPRGDRCRDRCMRAAAAQATETRETPAKRCCQSMENAVCVVHTNCASSWRATVRNNCNLVPSPRRLLKPSDTVARNLLFWARLSYWSPISSVGQSVVLMTRMSWVRVPHGATRPDATS